MLKLRSLEHEKNPPESRIVIVKRQEKNLLFFIMAIFSFFTVLIYHLKINLPCLFKLLYFLLEIFPFANIIK